MSSTVLVTGGTGGLGAAVTARFLASGWRVVVPQRHEVRSDGPGETRLELVQADLFDPAGAAACVERAAAVEAAPLTAVVNLVGGFAMTGRVHETPVEDFEDQLRLNLRPTYLMCHYAIPRLLAVGGSIVCVSSRAAVRPFAGAAGYVSAKAAILAFVDALHAEYVGQGLRVNAVLPSVIDTPANRLSQPDADFSRWVPPEQIADVIHFLCDPASTAVGGAHVPVYGRAGGGRP
jgi:NAD(P)-dependent dehydrogenase (short-subunit alcohol dehydrogenase family)